MLHVELACVCSFYSALFSPLSLLSSRLLAVKFLSVSHGLAPCCDCDYSGPLFYFFPISIRVRYLLPYSVFPFRLTSELLFWFIPFLLYPLSISRIPPKVTFICHRFPFAFFLFYHCFLVFFPLISFSLSRQGSCVCQRPTLQRR